MLRPAFRTLHSSLQRGGVLKDFAWLEGKYLLAIDGTGHFSSGKTCCPHCCVMHRNSGDEFYHQLLPASIVHSDHNKALPLDGVRTKLETGFKIIQHADKGADFSQFFALLDAAYQDSNSELFVGPGIDYRKDDFMAKIKARQAAA